MVLIHKEMFIEGSQGHMLIEVSRGHVRLRFTSTCLQCYI